MKLKINDEIYRARNKGIQNIAKQDPGRAWQNS